jgi:hypothetical protein
MPVMLIHQAQLGTKQAMDTDVYAACGTEDIPLIKLSIRTGHPVLIGLDGVNTIIQPLATGDAADRFEALYDRCYTLVDLARMQKAGVDDPTKIPPEIYRIAVEFPIWLICAVTIAVAAAGRAKAFAALRELLDTDKAFQTELRVHLLHIVLAYLSEAESLEPHVISVTAAGDEPLDPPLDPTGPPWRILDD